MSVIEGRARKRRRPAVAAVLTDALLFGLGILTLLPMIFLVSNGFKTPEELLVWPPSIIPHAPTVQNLVAVLTTTPLLLWIGNSLLFAVSSALAIVITSAIAGYVFGHFRFRSLGVVFVVILASAIVPFEVYMIPLYFTVQQLNLLNSTGGLVIGYLVMSFGIFFIRQSVRAFIPDELLEAARIDGASEAWIFVRIVVPLLRGPLGVLSVLAFFQAWTAFTWPLIVNNKRESYTIEVGLALFQTGYTVDLGRLSAAAAVVLVPSVLVFGLLRRNFVQGFAVSGLKE